eukprot:1897546-Amphidinium_carterae.2
MESTCFLFYFLAGLHPTLHRSVATCHWLMPHCGYVTSRCGKGVGVWMMGCSCVLNVLGVCLEHSSSWCAVFPSHFKLAVYPIHHAVGNVKHWQQSDGIKRDKQACGHKSHYAPPVEVRRGSLGSTAMFEYAIVSLLN